MRSQALERLGETKRKANEDCERKAKRQQRSGADVTEFHGKSQKRSLRSVKRSSLCKQEKLTTKMAFLQQQ